jgi:hypothetical protein
VRAVLAARGLQQPPQFVAKAIQLYDTLNVRFGVMLVGPTGGGKSACYGALQGALTRLRCELGHPDPRYQVGGQGCRSCAPAAACLISIAHLPSTYPCCVHACLAPRLLPQHPHTSPPLPPLPCPRPRPRPRPPTPTCSTPRPYRWASCTASTTPSAASGRTGWPARSSGARWATPARTASGWCLTAQWTPSGSRT